MRTLGVDLSADRRNAAACLVEWEPSREKVQLPVRRCNSRGAATSSSQPPVMLPMPTARARALACLAAYRMRTVTRREGMPSALTAASTTVLAWALAATERLWLRLDERTRTRRELSSRPPRP